MTHFALGDKLTICGEAQSATNPATLDRDKVTCAECQAALAVTTLTPAKSSDVKPE